MAVDPQLQGTVLLIAVSLGVLGNIPVVVSISLQRSLLKNNHYYLLLHLAICDLCTLLFFIPDVYSMFTANPSITTTSHLLCKIWGPAHTAVFTAGANFLVVISALRYRAILHPFKLPVTRRTLNFAAVCVHMFAIICILPYAMVLTFHEEDGCSKKWPSESLSLAYTWFLACVQFFLPVIILSFIYYKIGQEILIRNKTISRMDARNQIPEEHSSEFRHRQKIRNAKPLFVSFVIVLSFIVSGFPSQVLWIAFTSASKKIPSYAFLFNAIYIFGTSVINPFVYGALDKKIFSLFKQCRKMQVRLSSLSRREVYETKF
ncbi:neuropeptide FF receptor 2-like [Dendronephthya gigantea]|uniref:neuropeptide FF receptor 2-like n=1 Tax=Dendronephthya gigantea TaxID=151771 RepID=UPI00106D8303|nr:neuropeptide FF receptor 2-like [Dendronephthya gigantea]